MLSRRRRRAAGATVAVAGLALAVLVPSAQAGALASAASRAGTATTTGPAPATALPVLSSWQLVNSYTVSTLTAGQGLATLTDAGTSLVYRGTASIPLRLWLAGWQHIGDPDAHAGYVFDAYQGSATATSKLYEVTTPTGRRYDFVHRLATGEAPNNSFAALTPDGQWMVSGEWGSMSRLLVFRAPVLNQPASQPSLALAGTVQLATPVRNIQGCDFDTGSRLLCSSDGTTKQLLEVDLTDGVGAGTHHATVTPLGLLPLQSTCTGTFEAEGIDYAPLPRLMRVEVIPPSPCSITTRVYVYSPPA